MALDGRIGLVSFEAQSSITYSNAAFWRNYLDQSCFYLILFVKYYVTCEKSTKSKVGHPQRLDHYLGPLLATTSQHRVHLKNKRKSERKKRGRREIKNKHKIVKIRKNKHKIVKKEKKNFPEGGSSR